MTYTSLHTHTDFCDGKDSVETMCRSACEKGFSSIGFSSHAPLPPPFNALSDWHLPAENIPSYVDTVMDAKERWKGRLQVFLGLEIDYIPGICGPCDGRFSALPLDYSIASVHFIVPENGTTAFTVDGSIEELEEGLTKGFGNDGDALVRAYWDSVASMVEAGGFDILGHMDLIKKNNIKRPFFNPLSSTYREGWKKVLSLLKNRNIVVEVNTGGINRGLIQECYPAPEILSAMNCISIPLTVTADAHSRTQLGGGYSIAREQLLQAAYQEVVVFNGTKKAPWSREPV